MLPCDVIQFSLWVIETDVRYAGANVDLRLAGEGTAHVQTWQG